MAIETVTSTRRTGQTTATLRTDNRAAAPIEATIDIDDTKRTVAALAPTGERYVVEYASIWRNDQCVGTITLRADGPIVKRDLVDEHDLVDAAALRDWQFSADSEDDAVWFQAEEEAGRVSYPYGAS